jgi:tetratricopeptide (TPR) repeat protein
MFDGKNRLYSSLRSHCAAIQKLLTLTFFLALGACSGDLDDAPKPSLEEQVRDLRNSGNYAEALALTRNAIRNDPSDPTPRQLQGSLYHDAQGWSGAEIAFQKAIEFGATGTAIRLELSEALFMQNKFYKARDLLDELRYSSNRTEIEGKIRLAQALDKTGDLTRARRIFLQLFKTIDRESFTYEDPISAPEVLLDLERQREDYASLDAALGHREMLRSLPVGEWVMIHKQRVAHAVFFDRQNHGGSTFDTKRGQMILFGSDTHDYGDIAGKNWKNNIFFFDPAIGEWSWSYPRDPVSTYTVNADGIPVAGENANHPWAMHTYGAVSYDAKRDQVIVSSYPEHLEPGRFTYMLQEQWPKIRRHPTWIFDLRTNKWEPLATQAVSFFLNTTAYDSDRSVIVGYRDDGVYELSGSPRSWRKVLKKRLHAPDNNIVYDSKHKALVVFGGKGLNNDVVVYEPGTGKHRTMRTAGVRPPQGPSCTDGVSCRNWKDCDVGATKRVAG